MSDKSILEVLEAAVIKLRDSSSPSESVAAHAQVERILRDVPTLALQRARMEPQMSAIIEELSVGGYVRILDVYSEDELVEGAWRYLEALTQMDEQGATSNRWAWLAISSDHLDEDELWSVVTRLIRDAPEDDSALWAIGDGPMSDIQMNSGGCEKLTALAKHEPRLARIYALVERDLE